MTKIQIHVFENHQPDGLQKGTFSHPNPKVRVLGDSDVSWEVQNGDATFEVKFVGFKSPFTSGEFSITNSNPRRTTNVPGRYHYAVLVRTRTGDIHTIDDCPEFEVVTN